MDKRILSLELSKTKAGKTKPRITKHLFCRAENSLPRRHSNVHALSNIEICRGDRPVECNQI